ncbi:MAG: PEP-CTERM sorting domain-containing protein [Pirellulales bacterium]|nr:PEP-CTERM sorting domain-containing protein [Pirellulales bacterium]
MKKNIQSSTSVALVFALTFLFVSGSTSLAALTADGLFTPDEGYSTVYWVDFPLAPQVTNTPATAGWVGASGVGLGRLALGTDPTSGNHFMYYALPKGYVDNTYEATGNDIPPVVGTYEGSSGHKLGTGLIGSDSFGIDPFELYTTDGMYRMTVDYLADVKTSGTRTDIISAGINGVNDPLPTGASQWGRRDGNKKNSDDTKVLQIATSMEWNLDTYGPTGTEDISADDIATLSGYLDNSPDVVRETSGPDQGLAILAADGYSYQPAELQFADWIYEVAYEFEFDSSLFGPEWADPTTELHTLLTLAPPHASPNKGLLGQGAIGDPVFSLVPEPSAVLLMGLGLIGWGLLKRQY